MLVLAVVLLASADPKPEAEPTPQAQPQAEALPEAEAQAEAQPEVDNTVSTTYYIFYVALHICSKLSIS